MQTEIDLKSGDTSYWKIGWISDCEFNCDYISATITKSKKDESFYKNSTIKFSIIKTSKEYYVFEALFSSALLTKKYIDTVWLHEK